MPEFRTTVEIAAPPDAVWDVLGDLAAVRGWIPGIASVSVNANTRVCVFDDGHVQNEEILDYSPESRSFAYRIEGAPLPVSDNAGSFSVEPTAAGSLVIWESRFTPLDPTQREELARMWEPFLPQVLANLKSLVENR